MTEDDIPGRMLRVERVSAELEAEVKGLRSALSATSALSAQVAAVAATSTSMHEQLLDLRRRYETDITELRAAHGAREATLAEDRRSLRTAVFTLAGIAVTAATTIVTAWISLGGPR